MRARTYLLLLLINALFIRHSKGQEIITVQDFGTRTSIGLDYKFMKSYQLSFMQELRLFENATKIEEIVSELGLSYKIDKNFTIGSNLRYILNSRDDNSYSNDSRYNFDFKFKHKLTRKVKLKYRLRYQQLLGNYFTEDKDNTYQTKTNFRNKIELDYQLKNHLFYLSSELFRKYKVYRNPYFNKLRFYLGDEIAYKKGELNLSIGYEKELGVNHPLMFYFIRTAFTFKMKHEK